MAYKDPEDAIRYRVAHREEARERTRLWRLKHPGAAETTSKAWRERNSERVRENRRRWRAANRERVRATSKAWRLKTGYSKSEKRVQQSLKDWLRRYGLTPDSYEQIRSRQNGLCAICGSSSPNQKNARRLYVDHCHATHRVRGLLCMRCNTLLGAAQDSPERLLAAIAYLQRANT